MDAGTLQNTYLVILIIGIVMTAVGTLGNNHYSKKASDEKDLDLQHKLSESDSTHRAGLIKKDEEIAALQEKAKELEPPTLSLAGGKIDIDESSCTTLLRFRVSTSQPLVDIVLDAWIVSETVAKIISFKPVGISSSVSEKQKIFEDAKRAHIEYSPVMLTGLDHIVKIVTSSPCRLRITGSHNLTGVTFNLVSMLAGAESQNLKPPFVFEVVRDADNEGKVQMIKGFGQPDENAEN